MGRTRQFRKWSRRGAPTPKKMGALKLAAAGVKGAASVYPDRVTDTCSGAASGA